MAGIGAPNSTGFIGVMKPAPGRKTYRVVVQGTYIASFGDKVVAARAYDEAAKKLLGPGAKLNFPAE